MRDSEISKDTAFTASQSNRERDYWLNRLSGDLPKTSLSFDGQKPGIKVDDPVIAAAAFGFHGELFTGLMKLSNNSDYRLHIIMMMGLVLLIYKYTAQKDIIVVSPIHRQEAEGEFINTILTLRNRVNLDITIKEFLLQVAESVFEADENQNYPIKVLLYKLNLSVTPGNLPFTDIAILLENVHERSYLEKFRFNMVFTFTRKDESLDGLLEYNSAMYEKGFVERLITHFIHLLRQCIFGLELKISAVDMLPEEEKKQLLMEFNGKKADFPGDQSVYQFVEQHAEQSPDRTAVGFEEEHLTYWQLNRRANQLAGILRGSGIGEDCTVGILLNRSPLLAACILAVWKAGGAYIPVDTDYPAGRIVEIIKDSGAGMLLTQAKHVDAAFEQTCQGKIMLLDGDIHIHWEAAANLDLNINMNSLAYVIYTSGSTGKPKGVMVEHIGMINHIHAKINDLQLTAKSIVAQNSSYTFDISVWQFFAALTRGGKTIIYPYTSIVEPNQFVDRIIRDRVTILEVVPSYLSVILEVMASQPVKIQTLRYLLVTGEEIKSQLVKKWFEIQPGIKMVNVYGPTEASDDITHFQMENIQAAECTRISIGKPIQNMTIYIVDENMKLCPVGVNGEICVSGVGVGRGYLNNPGITAERFHRISDRTWRYYRSNKSNRSYIIYRTGDLGSWLPGGTIEFLGRKDHQVKIRGYRIELGEIEWNLMAHPSIKEAVVMDRKNPQGIQSLCAYLVPRERLEIPVIKEYLTHRLPGYMVPDYFILLDRVPLTPNGKIDRQALLEMKIHAPLTLPFISEEMLKKAMETKSSPGQPSHRLTGEETGRFFDNLTEALETENSILQKSQEQTADNRTYYPLSYAQRMMYYIEKRNPGTGCNNVVYTVKYQEKIDSELLEQAINFVIDKNEALRLRIVEIEHETSLRFAQYVSDYKPRGIDRCDFTGKKAGMSLEKWLEIDAHQGFDFTDSDLFYFVYIQFDEKTSGYYVKIHHIICDAVSIHFLISEINRIYRHLQAGKTIDHKQNPSYLQYITHEREYLKTSRAKEDMQSWINYILPPPGEVHLSPGKGEPGNTRAHMCKWEFPHPINREIYRYCKDHKTTPYRLLVAALSIYISRACGLDDMVIGTLNNNRSLFKYTRMFGIFIGFVPLRIKVEGDIGFNEFIKSLGKNINDIINNHQEFPFEILAAQLGESLGFDHRYFSNINLISHPDLDMEDFTIERHFTGYDAAPLSIYINRANKCIHGVLELDWVYREELYMPAEIEQIHHCLENILADALANPGKQISEIELLSPEEKNNILTKCNRDQAFPKIDIPLELPENPCFYIINEKGVLQPEGIPGELGVECHRVTRPHTKDTNHPGTPGTDKLIPNPFKEGGWIYRTGELASWQPEGNIKLLGRIEHQIHIKGIRIDSLKLENYLLQFTGIEKAVVTRQYNNGKPYLCAFITTKKEQTDSGLREYLSARFPLYMIPECFVILEKMPLTGDGKVDKKLLEQIEINAEIQQEQFKPRDEVEKKLAGIWAEVLGVEKDEITLNSNFFLMGGHSLNATILASKIHRAFNVKISLADIFKAPELVKLSGYIKGLAEDKYESLPPVEKREYYALSSAQKRLYILQQMYRQSTFYNMPNNVYLPEDIRLEKLEEAFQQLVNRHESLRTSFHMIDEEPAQRIHDKVKFKIEYYDLAKGDTKNTEGTSGLAPLSEEPADNSSHPAAVLTSSFIRPFDLSQAPLLRVSWVKMEHRQLLLLVDKHHIVSDGASHDILVNDLLTLYEGKSLPPLRIQYKDFSGWHNSEKHLENLKLQEAYWLKVFEREIQILEIPTDYARPPIRNFEGDRVLLHIDSEKTRALNACIVEEGVTLYMVLLAITNIFLAKIANQEDIVVGTALAGRKHSDLEEIIGMFVNTLALRNYPCIHKTFREFLQEVKESTLNAFENQDYQFENLVEKVAANRDLSRNPLFDVAFGVSQDMGKRTGRDRNNQPPEPLEPTELNTPSYRYENKTTKFDLTLVAAETMKNLVIIINYNIKLFKPESIERFCNYFKEIVSFVTDNKEIKLGDIKLSIPVSAPALEILQQETGDFGF